MKSTPLLLLFTLALSSRAADTTPPPAAKPSFGTPVVTTPAAPAPTPETAPAAPEKQPEQEKPVAPTPATNPSVILETSLGNITVELFADQAPLSVANFLAYADDKSYDGTIFHRVIDGFMIQGGGFTADMNQKPTRAPIKNEAANGLKNSRGTLAMARTSVIDSATAQFFINHKDNGFLDHRGAQNFGYAVFGKVTAGMDVVDKIATVPTGNAGPHQNVPTTPVTLKSVRRVTAP